MTTYYNEFDPFAAAWLMQLIGAGLIAPGVVDTRDLWDVTPNDLAGFTQVHFCAGIGVWSYALRRAGWPDDRPVWTASFPCQPFSAAGQGRGFADERHLWPAGLHLIEQCDPAVVLGEQVASKDGLAWLDLVRADLEGTGRAFAAADLCAAGVGAPHIRQRSYWLAYGKGRGRRERSGEIPSATGTSAGALAGQGYGDAAWPDRAVDGLDHGGGARLGGHGRGPETEGGRNGAVRPVAAPGELGGVADGAQRGRREKRSYAGGHSSGDSAERWTTGLVPSGPTNGFWRDADWLFCRDGKWRPVEPGTFPLAHGATNRVGRLRGYGNAIVAPVAETFIRSVMECV